MENKDSYIYTIDDLMGLFDLKRRTIQKDLGKDKLTKSYKAEGEHGRRRYLRPVDVKEYLFKRILKRTKIKPHVLDFILKDFNVGTLICETKEWKGMWIDRFNLDSYLEDVGFKEILPDDLEVENRTDVYWKTFGKEGLISYILFESNDKLILSIDINEMSLLQKEMFALIKNIIEEEGVEEIFFDQIDNDLYQIDYNNAEIRIGDIKDFSVIVESMKIDGIIKGYKHKTSFNSIYHRNTLKEAMCEYEVVGGVSASNVEEFVGEVMSFKYMYPIIKYPGLEKSIYNGEDITAILEEGPNGNPQLVIYKNELRR